MAPTLSIVVPCHNEEPVLPLLLDRVKTAALAWNMEYEVVCVDDGSSDSTWQVIERAGGADPRVRGVCLSRNFGQQAAVSAGMHYAGGQAVIVIDADLQDPPEAIPELVRSWKAGFKVVHAVRSQRKDRLLKRALASGFYRLLASVAPFRIPRDAGEFVLLDREVVDIINAMPEQDRYLRGLRAWCGFPQAEVLYKRDARAAGRPQYTFWKSLALALDGLVSFSTAPLRLATYLGAASLALALAGAAAAAVGRMRTGSWSLPGLDGGPAGTALLLVLLVLGLGGAQLACLGIAGEYLGRVANQVKGRPLWIASRTVGLSKRGPAHPPGISPPAGRA
jgi:polyisoprenyl-phosphate glycosyltransferase